MFTRAFLEEAGNGKLRHEEQLLRAEFARRGVPVSLFTAKRIQRRQLPLSGQTFIAGDMDAMHGAMRQLEIEIPPPNDYPKSLSQFMHRRIWSSTLSSIEQGISEETIGPVFAKPADRRKSFTGRVFVSLDDFRELGNVSRGQEVWCSEVVEWLSEYRIYVIGTQIVSIDLYAGDSTKVLDGRVISNALAVFRDSGEAPSAYGIDFGVLASGQTALVEANDGYALGAYQISATAYTELLTTRWSELISTIPG
jgi:hypothetical protein